MNKAVMISIQPKWCELIANGKKTVEVRKTRPRLETPFKVYIYCTNTPKYHHLYDLRPYNKSGEFKLGCVQHNRTSLVASNYINGKVIGEFVCGYINELHEYELTPQGEFYLHEKARLDLFLEQSCLSYDEICDYRKNLPYHKPLYAWKISNLVIYDKPKELSEFVKPCNHDNNDCFTCDRFDYMGRGCFCEITRPPQSWCYVQEVQND